ncbi:MAG: hypothetical protein ACI9SP_001762 [Arenicella sp.]
MLLASPLARSETDEEKLVVQIHRFLEENTAIQRGEAPQSQGNPLTPFIIGGNNASRDEYGEFSLVLIIDSRGNVVGACSGSLIAPNKVLTAAHCSQEPASNYAVIPNFYSANDTITPASFSFVSRVVDHPNHKAAAFDYDIGILTLTRSFSTPVARVHSGNNTFADKLGTTIGTGLTGTNPTRSSPVLQAVPAPIVSNSQCSENWSRVAAIDAMADFIHTESPQTQFVISDNGPVASVRLAILLLLQSDDTESEPTTPSDLPDPDLLNPAIEDFTDAFYCVALQSSEGESIVDGATRHYSPQTSNVTITKRSDRHISISIDGIDSKNAFQITPDDRGWDIQVASGALRAGVFSDSTRYTFNSGNGLSFSGNRSG